LKVQSEGLRGLKVEGLRGLKVEGLRGLKVEGLGFCAIFNNNNSLPIEKIALSFSI
jgi:hypothetical protein